jgi:glycosyltransferase involved in cell wall biosynthesis
MVSTYPPKLCGLATFAAALTQHLQAGGHRVDVVSVLEAGDTPGPGVLVNESAASVRSAAAALSRCDGVIIQHEYGIFGGPDGDEVLDLMDAITAPIVVVLHTVPLHPTDHQQSVLERVCAAAGQVVVMSRTADDRLRLLYAIDGSKVIVIPHGASLPTDDLSPAPVGRARPQLLTWGLLGPGKGIEHVIDALTLLADVHPTLRYTVAGVTHPKVLAHAGDEYRHSLIRRSWANGLAASVTFDDTYRDVPTLTRFVASSSLVVLPYDSKDQVTSGVLVDAIAAGRPVVATAFPHACDLLQSGAGIVVPHGDPVALAGALRSVMTDPDRLAAMTAEAQRLAPQLAWSVIAAKYAAVCAGLVVERAGIAS